MAIAQYVIIIDTIGAAFATLFVLLRLHLRFFHVKKPGPDDVLIIMAIICSIAYTILVPFQLKHGLGDPEARPTPQDVTLILQVVIPSSILYNLGIMFTKLAVFTQFLRFLTMSPYRQLCWASMVFTVCTSLATILWATFSCNPVQKLWLPALPGTCSPVSYPQVYLQTPSAVFIDLVICTLPIPALAALHLPRGRKYALLGVFLFGSFALVAALIRIYYVVEFHRAVITGNQKRLLFTLVLPNIAMLSSIELNVGMIAASLPVLRPLLEKLLNLSGVSASWLRSETPKLTGMTTFRSTTTKDDVVVSMSVISNKDIQQAQNLFSHLSKADLEDVLDEDQEKHSGFSTC